MGYAPDSEMAFLKPKFFLTFSCVYGIIILVKEGEITLRAVRKQKSIQELFADYDGGFLQTEEMDWGKPQGNEIW